MCSLSITEIISLARRRISYDDDAAIGKSLGSEGLLRIPLKEAGDRAAVEHLLNGGGQHRRNGKHR